MEFAEAFGIPVAETQAGKSSLPWNHPLNVGAIGVTGALAANRAGETSGSDYRRRDAVFRFYNSIQIGFCESECAVYKYKCQRI